MVIATVLPASVATKTYADDCAFKVVPTAFTTPLETVIPVPAVTDAFDPEYPEYPENPDVPVPPVEPE